MREHAVPTLLRPPALRRAVILFAVAWAAIGTGTAHAGGSVTVMTQNLYQGTEFAHIQGLLTGPPPTEAQVLKATTEDYATYEATRFKDRAKEIAAEIAQNKPVLVGLQEVATWHKGTFNPLAPFALPPTVSEDFTEVLVEALAADGAHYAPVSTERPDNFTLAFPAFTKEGFRAVGMVESGVILARADLPAGQLQLTNAQTGTYAARIPPFKNPLTGESIPFTNSWQSVDVDFQGKAFRFITTHLDALDPSGTVRLLQAKELLAGPVANTTLPVVLTGDMNSGLLSTPAAYELLAGRLSDTWVRAGLGAPPLTCCHLGPNDLVNEENTPYTEDLDHALTRGNFPVLDAHLVGNTVADLPNPKPEPFIWPSDHAGLVTTLGFTVITGTVNGPLVVKGGESITLASTAKINGPVTVETGGELDIEGGTVSGPVTANKAALLRLCGAMISGPVGATNGTGPVVIGEDTAGCPASIINGPVTVEGNVGVVAIDGNVVKGPLTVTGNAGGTTVVNNSVFGPLTVTGNSGIVVDKPNVVMGPSKLQ